MDTFPNVTLPDDGSTVADALLERISARIYDDFRVGYIDVATCEDALDSLYSLADSFTFAIPEPSLYQSPKLSS